MQDDQVQQLVPRALLQQVLGKVCRLDPFGVRNDQDAVGLTGTYACPGRIVRGAVQEHVVMFHLKVIEPLNGLLQTVGAEDRNLRPLLLHTAGKLFGHPKAVDPFMSGQEGNGFGFDLGVRTDRYPAQPVHQNPHETRHQIRMALEQIVEPRL